MAIDTTSLTQVISDIRKLQTKDSVTTESLGSILQRIADLLASAVLSIAVSVKPKDTTSSHIRWSSGVRQP